MPREKQNLLSLTSKQNAHPGGRVGDRPARPSSKGCCTHACVLGRCQRCGLFGGAVSISLAMLYFFLLKHHNVHNAPCQLVPNLWFLFAIRTSTRTPFAWVMGPEVSFQELRSLRFGGTDDKYHSALGFILGFLVHGNYQILRRKEYEERPEL